MVAGSLAATSVAEEGVADVSGDSTVAAFPSPGVRFPRSAAVVSVVNAAATCWRFVVVEPVERFLVVAELAVDARDVRADFAASPLAAAAFDDAARDAGVRFEGVGASGWSSDAGAVFAPSDAAGAVADPFAADPLAAAFGAVPFAAAAFAAVPFVAAAFAVVDLGFVDLVDFAVPDFAVPEVAADVEALGRRGAAGRASFCSPSDAGRATEVPRSADTPVPVPPGVSSSCSEGETEVTNTTYQ